MAGLEPYKHGYYLWKYVPSAAAAGIFCAIFGVVTIAFVWRIWKTRTWFCIPFAVGGYSTWSPLYRALISSIADLVRTTQCNLWATHVELPRTAAQAS